MVFASRVFSVDQARLKAVLPASGALVKGLPSLPFYLASFDYPFVVAREFLRQGLPLLIK